MQIVIPSSGRSIKQSTWNALPPEIQQITTIVVPATQVEDYQRSNPAAQVRGLPADIPLGVGPSRQWCLENSTSSKLVMIDDDLVFATRREHEPTKFRDSNPTDVTELFTMVERLLNKYASVGLSTREGGNRNIDKFDYNTRVVRFQAYRTDILTKEGIRFDAMHLMEDFYVTLSLLTRGYQNCKINHMVHNQKGSGTEGGCSKQRNWETQEVAANLLHSRFPEFVKVVQKVTKDKWCANPSTGARTDVNIQWKQAYKSAEEQQDVRPTS